MPSFDKLGPSIPGLKGLLTVRGLVWLLGWFSVLVACSFAVLTRIAWNEAGGYELPVFDLGAGTGDSAKVGPPPRSTISAIVARGLLGKVEGPRKSKPPRVEPKVVAKTELKLRLVGTFVFPEATSYASIEDTAKRDQGLFAVGEQIFSQAKLVGIFPDYVRLKRAGKVEVLYLEDDSAAGASPFSSRFSRGTAARSPYSALFGNRDARSSREEKTDFRIDSEELEKNLANLPRLLSQARAVPYFRDGKSIGMRLFAIRRNSLYEKLGLRNGDILKAVNENGLADPTQALRLFEQLRNERSINLTIERRGKTMDMNYNID